MDFHGELLSLRQLSPFGRLSSSSTFLVLFVASPLLLRESPSLKQIRLRAIYILTHGTQTTSSASKTPNTAFQARGHKGGRTNMPFSHSHPALTTNMLEMESSPPLLDHFEALSPGDVTQCNEPRNEVAMEGCQFPLIDLSDLNSHDPRMRQTCCSAIYRASSEWGFFQVVNHGISPELLEKMRREQMRLFRTPFERKTKCGVLDNSYRWGTPSATCPKQFSWSEAFHIRLSKISDDACYGEFIALGQVMTQFAAAMSKLAMQLAGVLAENLGHPRETFDGICNKDAGFLRLNRYPACPLSPDIFGLVPHTDSDFLTILFQDEVGGLQLMKDSKWVAVKPNQDALIINIGDLFQAWSNGIYKSVEHKVMTNANKERYSIAYFLCPACETLIGSYREPSMYRKFTFGEYRSQVQEDVKKYGHKIGLPRFLR